MRSPISPLATAARSCSWPVRLCCSWDTDSCSPALPRPTALASILRFAERRLNSLRQIAAALPAKEAALKQAEADLASREKSILVAGTAAQAQAKLLEVVRRVSGANGIDIRGGDFPPPKTFGDAYGEVFAGVSFNCRIDQFVNFFADLSREPDLLAPSELPMMNGQDQKSKILSVRMILSGVVPRKLVFWKKEGVRPMKRLLLWNFLLAICATAGIYELRKQWAETRAQEQAVLLRKPVQVKPDTTPPPVKPAPFQATSYVDVAQKTLFAKDRNPNIEIVAPPPPPPPPPMPALPRVYGVMGLPSGAVAIMSDKPGGEQKRDARGASTTGEPRPQARHQADHADVDG